MGTEVTTQIEFIRQKCIEANPSIVTTVVIETGDSSLDYFFPPEGSQYIRPIRLADVLATMESLDDYELYGASLSAYKGELYLKFRHREAEIGSILIVWKIRNDDLNLQLEQTIKSIYELLK